jgi:hypothetical protein
VKPKGKMRMDWSQAEEYFQKYYDKLIWETILARAHLKLNERLDNYRSSYLKELNQAPHFFKLTMLAHYNDALLTLSRILDQHEDSLSIWKFLNFVEQNCRIFSNQAFRQRMKGNPNYESLTKSHTPVTPKEVDEDRQKLGSLQDIISRLRELRDKVLAHTDRTFYLNSKITTKKYTFERKKLYEVTDTIAGILNRYSHAHNASTFVIKIPGEDDIEYVMNSIRFAIEERKKQLEALRRQARDKR